MARKEEDVPGASSFSGSELGSMLLARGYSGPYWGQAHLLDSYEVFRFQIRAKAVTSKREADLTNKVVKGGG